MNVVKTENGEQYIPASQRADGTWRKPRKVKDGYVPQDEVPLYQSKGKQWAAGRSSYPVGLDPALVREKELKEAAAAEKLRKQKAQKKAAALQTTPSASQAASSTKDTPKPLTAKEPPKTKEVPKQQTKKVAPPKTSPEVQKIDETPRIVPVDATKKLRNLKKKLKEIEALELKIKNKELKNPDKDQLEKVGRRKLLEDEILALELSISWNVS